MNFPLRQVQGFFLLLVAGVLLFTFAAPPASPYIGPLLLFLTGIVVYATRTWKDRVFYLLCAGQPLVIALSAVLIWAGLFAVWMLAGIVLADLGMLASASDWMILCSLLRRNTGHRCGNRSIEPRSAPAHDPCRSFGPARCSPDPA